MENGMELRYECDACQKIWSVMRKMKIKNAGQSN